MVSMLRLLTKLQTEQVVCRGDLPLWGAVLALLDHPIRMLPLPYYHGSHYQTVNATHSDSNMVSFGSPRNSSSVITKVRVTLAN